MTFRHHLRNFFQSSDPSLNQKIILTYWSTYLRSNVGSLAMSSHQSNNVRLKYPLPVSNLRSWLECLFSRLFLFLFRWVSKKFRKILKSYLYCNLFYFKAYFHWIISEGIACRKFIYLPGNENFYYTFFPNELWIFNAFCKNSFPRIFIFLVSLILLSIK